MIREKKLEALELEETNNEKTLENKKKWLCCKKKKKEFSWLKELDVIMKSDLYYFRQDKPAYARKEKKYYEKILWILESRPRNLPIMVRRLLG